MRAAGAAVVAVGSVPRVIFAVVGGVAVGAVGAAGVEGGVEEEEQRDVVGRGGLYVAVVCMWVGCVWFGVSRCGL